MSFQSHRFCNPMAASPLISLSGQGTILKMNKNRLQRKANLPAPVFSSLYIDEHILLTLQTKGDLLTQTALSGLFTGDSSSYRLCFLLPMEEKKPTCTRTRVPVPFGTEKWQKPQSKIPELHLNKTFQKQPLPHPSLPP